MSDVVAQPWARRPALLHPVLSGALALYLHRSLFAAWGAAVPLGVALSAGVAQLPSSGLALTEPGGLLLADLAHSAVHSDLGVLPAGGWLALSGLAGLIPLCCAVRSLCTRTRLASFASTLRRLSFVWAIGLGTLVLMGVLALGASVVTFAWLHRAPNERFADLVSLTPLLLLSCGLMWHAAWLDAAYVRVAKRRMSTQSALSDSLGFVRSRAARVGLAQATRWGLSVALVAATELAVAAMPPGPIRVWLGLALRQLSLLAIVVLRMLWLSWLQTQQGQRNAFS